MKFSNDTTVSWNNGWSVEIKAGFLTKISIMGPRQVFYSLYRNENAGFQGVQAEADQVWNYVTDQTLLAILGAMKDMPNRPVITPCGLVVEEEKTVKTAVAAPHFTLLAGREVPQPSCDPLVDAEGNHPTFGPGEWEVQDGPQPH